MFEKLAKTNYKVGFFGGVRSSSFEVPNRLDPNKKDLIQGFKITYYEVIKGDAGIGFDNPSIFFVTLQKFKDIFGNIAANDIAFRDCVISCGYNQQNGKKSLKAVAFI